MISLCVVQCSNSCVLLVLVSHKLPLISVRDFIYPECLCQFPEKSPELVSLSSWLCVGSEIVCSTKSKEATMREKVRVQCLAVVTLCCGDTASSTISYLQCLSDCIPNSECSRKPLSLVKVS